jgi:hypothetical protein
MSSALRGVLLGGAIAGALDMTYAVVFFSLRDVPAMRVFQSVASGVLGQAAYSGGAPTALLGLALHFFIAITAAATFYAVSLRFGWLVRHAIVSGVVFGLCVFAVMNFVIVPLSAFPQKLVFRQPVLTFNLLVHMFLVGLPIALCIRAATLRKKA